MDRNRRAMGLGVATAVVTALLIVIPASLAIAARSTEPTLTPPNGQTAVKPGDEVVFGGTADEGATLVSSFLRVRGPDGSVVQDDIDATDGTSVAEGSISGSWILPFLEPDAETVELHVVVDSGGTEVAGVSAPVQVDQIRPAIRGAELISGSQVRVRFTEPVDTPPSRDQALDWFVDGVPPQSVEGSGAARVLNLTITKDRDATPTVDYLPRAPLSESYRDGAHNNVSADERPTIARDLTPPPPPDVARVAGKVPSGGTVVANDPTPNVRLTGIREGDIGQVYLETNDQPGFQLAGDTLLGEGEANAEGVVVITAPDLGADGNHVLYGVAHDRAKCDPTGGVDECPNHSDGTEVTYRLDTVAPLPLFAVNHGGTDNAIDVRFTEPVGPDGGDPADWSVSSGQSVSGVEGTGDERTLDVDAEVPAGATLSFSAATTQYTDAAGNELDPFSGLDLLNAIPPVLQVTDPETDVHVNADTATIQGEAEQAAEVLAYRDTNGNGELDAGEEAAGPVATSSVSRRAAGTPFAITVPLEQNADNHFVLRGERTEPSGTVAGPVEDVPTIIEDSVAPTLALQEPNGDEVLRGEETFTIEWDADDDRGLGGSPIRIDYSANGGGTWTTIADRIANSGEYDWTTPGASTEQARIRIFATDRAGNTAGPSTSPTFVIDAIHPFFVAQTVNATTVRVQFSEPVNGMVSQLEWRVDGQLVSGVSSSGGSGGITELTLTPSQRIGSRDTPTVEYRPLPTTSLGGNELGDRARNPILPKIVVAADGIFCDFVFPQDVRAGVMEGTEQDDVFCTLHGNVTVHAKGGDDVVTSTGGTKIVHGGEGNDRIQGGTGNNQLFGGPGNDVIDGGPGNDLIDGAEGNDRINPGAGNDQILAGSGIDHVFGGDGNDRIDGGQGNDHLDAGPGKDLVLGRGGRDLLLGGDGKDLLRGARHRDVIRGGKGRDLLAGQAGKDRLFGEGGRDRLRGGKGRDRMNGGPAKDICQGGGGRDTARRCEGGRA